MACNVVCISHETGAGGEQVGRRVAERLGFLFVDEEIVVTAAAQAGVDPATVADEERRRSLARRVLDALAAGSPDLVAFGGGVPLRIEDESDRIRAFVRETILQVAARGDVVISAHAASFAVPRDAATLRVLVAASPDTRAARLRDDGRLGAGEAARAVKAADAGRSDYLKRFYDVDRELPTHYDVVVNTDVLDAERAAQIIAFAATST